MISWDIVMVLGQALTLLGPITILRSQAAKVPRTSSGSLVIALSTVALALYGLGAPLGATMTAIVAAVWIGIFFFRNTPSKEADSE